MGQILLVVLMDPKKFLKDQNAIVKNAATKRVDWKFIPPKGPHFGGVHETMVKSAKKAIYAVLSNTEITDEELVTAITGAEGLINSRPITYQSANPSDDIVLTPNHFLIGQLGGQLAPQIPDTDCYDIRKRWRFVQELLRHFWKRWLKEYLPTLGTRSKWFHRSRDFKVDDVVLLVDPEIPRGHWPLGKIVKVYSGQDGHVRVVDLKIGETVLRRPITRLSFITDSSENNH